MKKLQKIYNLIDRVFYFVVSVFVGYASVLLMWLLYKLFVIYHIPSYETLQGLTMWVMLFFGLIILLSVISWFIKCRIDFLNKFGELEK